MIFGVATPSGLAGRFSLKPPRPQRWTTSDRPWEVSAAGARPCEACEKSRPLSKFDRLCLGLRGPHDSSQLLSDHPVPPNHRAGHHHACGRESEERPNRLRRLVTEPGALARNPDAINTSEMQVGEPIDNLIHNARSGVGVRDRLDSV